MCISVVVIIPVEGISVITIMVAALQVRTCHVGIPDSLSVQHSMYDRLEVSFLYSSVISFSILRLRPLIIITSYNN